MDIQSVGSALGRERIDRLSDAIKRANRNDVLRRGATSQCDMQRKQPVSKRAEQPHRLCIVELPDDSAAYLVLSEPRIQSATQPRSTRSVTAVAE